MREELIGLLEPTVAALGYELVELEQSPAGGVLRIFIDAPQGITVDDCERVSRQVSAVLDAADPIPGRYTLEVSSPGLDRVLRTPEHFGRFLGRDVKVQLSQPLDGRRRFTGRLLEVLAEGVALEVDGARVLLGFGQMQKARLVPVL